MCVGARVVCLRKGVIAREIDVFHVNADALQGSVVGLCCKINALTHFPK